MKKKVLGIAAVTILSLGLVVSASSTIKVMLDGRELKFGTSVKIEDGRAIAPVRTIAEELGAVVSWDDETKSVIIDSKKDKSLELQISNLEKALAPKDHLSAVTTWAEGVKMRNGALQYALMSLELKKENYADFAAMNWSTGVSSPWIVDYKVIEKGKIDDNTYIYNVDFTYIDSTKSTFRQQQNITVKKFDDRWLISSIENIDVKGEITKLTLGDNKKSTSIFVENKNENVTSNDKATLMIKNETKIYKGYTNVILSASDLKEGMLVEAEFDGPTLMMYPVQGGAKVIRVIE